MNKIPNYTIERAIGEGGMAIVYLAVQDMLHRKIALKVMRPELTQNKNFQESFLSEGATIANLEHSNIIRIHDIGITADKVFYMAMEYMQGGNLKERLDQGKLSYSHTLFILEEIANGLAYAHKQGYIHRDIKPANILFRGDGIAVLSDFGLAKLQDSSGELTRLGFTKGTVQYMSPEQMITTELDQRSDIYSLGLVFYEMLTGAKAFLADSTVQAIHQHTTVAPPNLPLEYSFLQPVLDKVLAKNPQQRYQTVDEFVVAVKTAKQLPLSEKVSQDDQNKNNEETVLHVAASSEVIPPAKNKVKTKNKTHIGLIFTSLLVVLGSAFGVYQYTSSNQKSANTPITEKIDLAQLAEQSDAKNNAVVQQNIKVNEKTKQDSLELQKTKEDQRIKQQQMIADERAKEEREKEAREKEEEQKLRIEKLAKEKAKKIADERQKRLDKQQAEKEARQLKRAKQKAIKTAIKKEKEKKERLKKEKIAKEKARKKALAKKQREKEKKEEAEKAKKKQDKQKQFAKHHAQIKVSVTLDGRPLKTYIAVTKKGKRIQVAKGKSFAIFTLPLGQYTVSANYNGKKATAVTRLEEGDIVMQRLVFRTSSHKKPPIAHPQPAANPSYKSY